MAEPTKIVNQVSSPMRALKWVRNHEVPGGGIAVHSAHPKAYPEVSGYFVPTLLQFGEREMATRLVRWLISVQLPSGAYADPNRGEPYIFDTGQVLRGLLAGVELAPGSLDAARRAADFLCAQMVRGGKEGFGARYAGKWHEASRSFDTIPESIHLYVLPPLLQAAKVLQEPEYLAAVERCFAYYTVRSDTLQINDLTHFLGYELEALIELGRADIAAPILEALRKEQAADGSIRGAGGASWVCCPGLAQLAVCWYKVGQWEPADKALAWLEAHQAPSGGFLGSHGPGANYFPQHEVSWAVKYYLDAHRLRVRSFMERSTHSIPGQVPISDGRAQAILKVVCPGDKVLEVGCGKGRFLKIVREAYPDAQCTGVDISPVFLRELPVEIQRIEGSLESIPCPEHSFDVAFSVDAVEHSPNWEAAIAEMIRVTRPGGWVVVIDKQQSHWGRFVCPPWECWPDAGYLRQLLMHGCDDVTYEPISYDDKPADGMYLAWRGRKRSVQRLGDGAEYADAFALRVGAEQQPVDWSRQIDKLQEVLAEKRRRLSEVEATLRHNQELLSALAAERDRFERVLQSRRYWIANLVATSWWLVLHPGHLAARIRHEARQWLRTVLPPSIKKWLKRTILRQRQNAWDSPDIRLLSSTAVSVNSGRGAMADAPSELLMHLPRQPKFDLIIFGIIDWHFRFQRSQQLACQFADNGHRVFYVGTSFADAPPKDGKTAPIITRIRSNVYGVHLPGPPTLSVYRSRLEGEVLERCATVFQTLQQEQGIVDAISFVQLPFWRPLAARLRNEFGWKVVYDCLDRHSGFSTNGPAMLAEEATLKRTSDLVVTTARVLQEDCSASNPRCVLVPNATDFDHFGAFVGEVPPWLQQLQRPVIGYYGAIAEWFDTALVGQMARMRPQWSFVLVGGTYTADLRPLEGLSNVHLSGEQPYKTLPAYLHSFDVCLIPFRRLPLTEATNPVKFYEYLSAGKPVVSALLPELRPFEADGLIYLADDAATFVAQVERAMAENSVDRVSSRVRFAKRETWGQRYHLLADEMCRLYGKVSIIILTHNNLHLTRLCVDSVLRNTTWPNYELLIVDNASTDETPAYLQTLSERDRRVRCILNARNEGFARANNQGIAVATGDYLALLNNDTIVTRGWLTNMIRYLETHSDVGMIGPATNETGNEAKIDVDYASVEEMEAFAERYTREQANLALELNMISFFCAVIPRRVLDKIGLLDEKFGIGMFEDDDLSLRARRAGYRLVCFDGAFVHHGHNATWKHFGEEEYLRVFQENRRKFERKWNIRWTPHRYRWQR